MAWLLLTTLLAAAYFTWRLFAPSPPIRVARDTTHITEPLRPDGLPNYSAHLLASLRHGVTLQNNAAVVMWQTFGQQCDYDSISADDWELLDRELSLGPPPSADQALTTIYSPANRAAVLEWLAVYAPDWPGAIKENPAALAEIHLTQADVDADEVISAALESPWQRSDLPPLADWLDRNSNHLDALVDASHRTKFYSPSPDLLRDSNAALVEGWSFDQIVRARALARVLRVRAMLHVGENQPERAWQDLLAIHRWARLIDQGPLAVDHLVALAIDRTGIDATTAFLGHAPLTPQFARQVLVDVSQLPPLVDFAEIYDRGERLYFLDAVLSGSRQGVGTFMAKCLDGGESTYLALRPLDFVSIDWNTVLAEGNRWQDQIVAACRLSDYQQRQQEFERLSALLADKEQQASRYWRRAAALFSLRIRSEWLTAKTLSHFLPCFDAGLIAQDIGTTNRTLLQIAAALAVFRSDHGQYPDRVEQLVPAILPQLPVDLFHSQPFVYRPDADGYLLYSCGQNGIDDGGSTEFFACGVLHGRPLSWHYHPDTESLRTQIPPHADDHAIRVPAPKFQLPWPYQATT